MLQDKVVVIGTAGHVDHGKSALLKALTGTDPDRLAVERERGMTIDLGFAWCRLASGMLASFVDVPGHEDLVHHMVAGATATDAVLLVVAADEGPMPQTLEHLQILDLLGITRGVVALTKTDLVDAEWLALIRQAVHEMLASTSLADAPLVEVSAVTGDGLGNLTTALDRILASTPPPLDRGRPRLPIDRVFTLAGLGTIVAGTLRDGTLGVGQAVVLLPSGLRSRARSIHTYGQATSTAGPGARTAVNVAGVDVGQIRRGDVLVADMPYPVSQRLDVELRVLPTARPVRHDMTVAFFHGAGQIPARVRTIGGAAIGSGESGYAQLILATPAVVAAGDRFVIRQPSPSRTLGGGRVLDPCAPRRWRRLRPETRQRFEDLASGAADRALWHLVEERQPCRLAALPAAESGLEAHERDLAAAMLEADGRVKRLGEVWFTDRGWDALRRRAEATVAGYHARHPLRQGMAVEELRQRLGLDGEAFAAFLVQAAAEGWLVRAPRTVALPRHQVRFRPEEQAAAAALLARFRTAPYTPPSAKEARLAVGPEVLAALVERQELMEVSDEVLLSHDAYEQMRQAVLDILASAGQITIADLRDRFKTSRRYAQAFLEHLDRLHVTRRQGDAHVADVTSERGGSPRDEGHA